MADIIRRDIYMNIGGDHQRISWAQTEHSRETFKHILLPVWMAAFQYKGKTYRYIVNAQTGTVHGQRPYSIWKIAFSVSLVLTFTVVLGAWLQANGYF